MTKQKSLSQILITAFLLSFVGLLNTVSSANLESSPSIFDFKQECDVSFDLNIDTFGIESNAADVEIRFNPQEVTILDQDSSIAGIQVQEGDAYEAYFVNEVDSNTGTITLASASFGNYLNGAKTLATIHFKSNPQVTSANFEIDFRGVDQTLDSNIARASDSTDLLANVTNASFTFSSGGCEQDTDAPTIELINPTPRNVNTDPETQIDLEVGDIFSGVDINTVEIVIDGVIYSVANGNLTYNGSDQNYTITIIPIEQLPEASPVTIIATALDKAGNRTDYSETFFTWANVENKTTPICEVQQRASCSIDSENIPVLARVEDIRSDNLPDFLNEIIDETSVPGLIALAILLYLALGSIFMSSLYGVNNLLNVLFGSIENSKYNLFGLVRNESTKKVQDLVLITAKKENSNHIAAQAMTDSSGMYKLNLAPGNYIITAKYENFSKSFKDDIVTIERNITSTFDVEETLGKPNSSFYFASKFANSIRVTTIFGLLMSISALLVLNNIFTIVLLLIFIFIITIPVVKK